MKQFCNFNTKFTIITLYRKSFSNTPSLGTAHSFFGYLVSLQCTIRYNARCECFDEEYDHKRFNSSAPFGIKYSFHLEDAVDCPEWIVSFPVCKSLAEEYDLEFVFVKNFHEFVDQYLKMPQFAELMRHLGALGNGNQGSPDEWEVAYLYSAFVLKKRGEPDPNRRRANRANNGPAMHINN